MMLCTFVMLSAESHLAKKREVANWNMLFTSDPFHLITFDLISKPGFVILLNHCIYTAFNHLVSKQISSFEVPEQFSICSQSTARQRQYRHRKKPGPGSQPTHINPWSPTVSIGLQRSTNTQTLNFDLQTSLLFVPLRRRAPSFEPNSTWRKMGTCQNWVQPFDYFGRQGRASYASIPFNPSPDWKGYPPHWLLSSSSSSQVLWGEKVLRYASW